MNHGWQWAGRPVAKEIRNGLVAAALTAVLPAFAQQSPANDDGPMARMRPIGAASAVDRFESTSGVARHPALPYAAGFPVQQAVAQGPSDGSPLAAPSLPPGAGGMTMPAGPTVATPPSLIQPSPFRQPPTAAPLPTANAPGQPPAGNWTQGGAAANPSPLPSSRAAAGGGLQPVPITRGAAGDMTPLPQPELSNEFATVENCACVSAPSSYTAAGFWGCGPPSAAVVYPAAPVYAPPPAVVVPPTVMPTVAAASIAPCRPLISLGQGAYNAQLGQGIIGQPTAYVPGQSIRNFIRYLSP